MWSLRTLTPFLAVTLCSIAALVAILLVAASRLDQQAAQETAHRVEVALQEVQASLRAQAQQGAAWLSLLPDTPSPAVVNPRLQASMGSTCLLLLDRELSLLARYTCAPEYEHIQRLPPLKYTAPQQGSLLIDATPYLYALAPVPTQDARRHLLLKLQVVDALWLQHLQANYRLPELKFSTFRPRLQGMQGHALYSPSQDIVGYLVYTRPTPGRDLVRSVLMPLFAGILLIMSIALIMARQMAQLVRQREKSQTRLRNVIDLVPHMIYARDKYGRFILANHATAKLYHCSPKQMIGRTVGELTNDQEAHQQAQRSDRQVLDTGQARNMEEERIRNAQGEERLFHTSKLIYQDDLGFNSAVLSVSIDVTQQRQQELKLRLLSNALEHSGSAILIAARQGEIQYINNRFAALTGYAPEEVTGQPIQHLFNANTRPEARLRIWRNLRKYGHWRGEVQFQRKEGAPYWSMVSISPIRNRKQEITHYVVVSEDISELKRAHQQMEKLAFYDTLTGLENRRLFRERLKQAIRAAKRTREQAALLYLDLDRFKRINDTLGHDAGDQLLVTVAQRLRRCVRSSDSIARLGGDEFTVLLPQLQHLEHAAIVARKIIAALTDPIQLGNHNVIVTTSIGITLAPNDGDDITELMKNADLAMYRAKSEGRNNYQFFTAEMNLRASEQLMLESELRHALKRREFSLRYQPQISLSQGRVVGLEALVRWEHPERGTISPLDFVPVAEETGLIVELGYQILEQACQDAVKFQHLLGEPVYMAVNISPRQFRDIELVEAIRAILQRTGLNPHQLELEITESTLMEQIDQSLPMMHDLEQLGISLSIDDFGTGYSSLSYLKQLPVHSLKIDRSFIQEIPHDQDDMSIISAVTAMTQKLKIAVVAEGVETREQLDFLADHQCDLIQGYLFSPPVTALELAERCAQIRQQLQEWQA